ncbi:MAG TPA: 50S ribosomal protein L20 [Fibrobacteraceae bacterium]|jgi:large subunit ribosomal protein L20|nr:50S ribosomal protein L20 [Fibrobacter sp.]HPW94753.1 50S ribosomal protein L20 [Fibrobacteraceae bacterium]HQB65271.1 50S ribosomal protein L20 [Fibrobacteraceae bacterium]
MPRSKSRVPSRERRKKILKAAKGFYGRRKSNIRIAIDAVAHAGQYAYAHRRDKKGDFRTLWITRLNAAVREHGVSYSQFIFLLGKANVKMNRKVLADMAVADPAAFAEVVKLVKSVA